VHPVDPDVDLVPVGRLLHERPVLVLPGLDESGDHRGREPGRRPEETLERRCEVPGRQSVQVEQWQHLGDLRGPPAPRRDDRGFELRLLAGLLVDAPVVHPRSPDRNGPSDRLDASWPGMSVAGDECVSVLVPLVTDSGEIRVHLGLEGSCEHLPSPLSADLVQHRLPFRAGSLVVHYAQHRRSLLAGVPPPAARS
jgi:hypothetical protein